MPKIETPTRVRWGENDPILKVRWADRLGDYFADLDFAPMPEAGHFAHYERPDLANPEILDFFRARNT
jgi:pimeloyl-ACP methyl ester carboxylesterase